MPVKPIALVAAVAEDMRARGLQVMTMPWPNFYYLAELERFRPERKQEIVQAGLAAGLVVGFGARVVTFCSDADFAPSPTKRQRRARGVRKASRGSRQEGGEFKETVAATCRHMINELLYDNATIASKILPHFDLPVSRKSYPGWYRAQLRRHGKLNPSAPAR